MGKSSEQKKRLFQENVVIGHDIAVHFEFTVKPNTDGEAAVRQEPWIVRCQSTEPTGTDTLKQHFEFRTNSATCAAKLFYTHCDGGRLE